MADRLNWTRSVDGWRQGDQNFAWSDADYKVEWDFALHLCKGVAEARPGLEAGLATQTLRQLKLDGQSQAAEDPEHIVHHCPAWSAKRREVGIHSSSLEAFPCVKLHGLLPAPMRQ
eukprot:3000546-Amphidinium_carterae.1